MLLQPDQQRLGEGHRPWALGVDADVDLLQQVWAACEALQAPVDEGQPAKPAGNAAQFGKGRASDGSGCSARGGGGQPGRGATPCSMVWQPARLSIWDKGLKRSTSRSSGSDSRLRRVAEDVVGGGSLYKCRSSALWRTSGPAHRDAAPHVPMVHAEPSAWRADLACSTVRQYGVRNAPCSPAGPHPLFHTFCGQPV